VGALLLAAVILSAALASASVYGPDERQGGGARTVHRYDFVGLLFAPGERSAAGTATLVAPSRILTAAHVLFDPRGELHRPLAALRFRTGADFVNEPYRDFQVTRLVAAGSRRVHDPADENLDWAVLEIAPGDRLPAAVSLLPADAAIDWRHRSRRVELAAYHRDVAEGMARVATACHTLAAPDGRHVSPLARAVLSLPGVLAHDCDAAALSSGAGLFVWYDGVWYDGRPHLAAIHVGKLGPDRAKRPDLARAHFNVALELGSEIRAAIVAP
jgi:hypothetical protein